METRWLLIPSPPTPCSSVCRWDGAGWGPQGAPWAWEVRHPHPEARAPHQPPGLSASLPPAELGDPAVASRSALCSWRGQQLSASRNLSGDR